MDENLSRLKAKLSEIESLQQCSNWGPEFQLWVVATKKLIKDLFGEDGLSLFEAQKNRTTSYIDAAFNRRQYLKELDKRKKIIEGLLVEVVEYKPSAQNDGSEKDILKEIWQKQEALKENLLTTDKAQRIQERLLAHLEKTFPTESVPGLKLRKICAEKRLVTWWSDANGYPTDNPWEKIEPFLIILQQHEAEKTIKHRFETKGLFVESRSQNGDQHLLIGERNGNGDKAHVIIDHKTGEVRVEKGRQEPTEVLNKVEAILTLKDGKRIRTTREAIEEIPTDDSHHSTSVKNPLLISWMAFRTCRAPRGERFFLSS